VLVKFSGMRQALRSSIYAMGNGDDEEI